MQIDFHSSESSSLGIEMELEIVDVDTRELHSGASEILANAGAPYPGGVHPKAKHELLESTIEIITGICSTAAEARADLESTLAELQPYLDRRDLAFICSGTHPFSDWAKQQISPNPRYERLVEEPERCLRRIVAHLGLAFHPALMRHHVGGTGTAVGGTRRDRPIDRESVGAWRNSLTPGQISDVETICAGALAYWDAGYGSDVTESRLSVAPDR